MNDDLANVATTRLQAILATCLLRRKKDTELDGKRLIDLPLKDVHLRKLDFSPEEREIYNMVSLQCLCHILLMLMQLSVLRSRLAVSKFSIGTFALELS